MMQQQKISYADSRDCQHQSSVGLKLPSSALNSFVVFAKGARQAASKHDTDNLNDCNANTNAAKQQRFVIEELVELWQASDLRCVIAGALLYILRQQMTTHGGNRFVLEDRAPVDGSIDAAAF